MSDASVDYDLKTVTQIKACDYEAIRRRGRGTYGFVYEVTDKIGDIFAFKYILPDPLYNIFGLDGLTEIDILSRVDHPHVIHAAKVITSHNCEIDGLAVILPLADRTLHDIIYDPHMTTDYKLPILYKLAKTLEFLHNNHILHLDIKSTNVVLQDFTQNNPYFIDFGLSMIVDNPVIGKTDPNVRVTIDHRAPELLIGGETYNAAVDIWAFGIMALYLISSRGIYNIDLVTVKPRNLYLLIVNTFSDAKIFDTLLSGVREKYRPLCKDFFTKILKIDPADRLSIQQICNHPLFDEFRVPIEGRLIESYIPHEYAGDHRNILKIIIHWAKLIYQNCRAEMLFLAVDLFNRLDSFYKDRTPLDRMSLASTCLWMAAKLTESKLVPLDVYIPLINGIVPDITSKSILETEVEIIHLLNGILHISKLYRECKTSNELILSFQYIILDQDSTLYARTDIDAWLIAMKTIMSGQNSPNTDTNKDITISQLLA